MMFLDCPAYLDEEGALRCGLPAEVKRRFTMRSTGGFLESVMIRCPSGHWFNGPIEFLALEKGRSTIQAMPKLLPALGGTGSSALMMALTAGGGFVMQESTGQREQEIRCPTAPRLLPGAGRPPVDHRHEPAPQAQHIQAADGLGDDMPSLTNVALSRTSDGHLGVLATSTVAGSEPTLWHAQQSPDRKWSGWHPSGKPGHSRPTTVSVMPHVTDGRLEASTATVRDPSVWHRWQTQQGTSNWSQWQRMATFDGGIEAGPVAMGLTDGRLMALVASGGIVMHATQWNAADEAWPTWTPLGKPNGAQVLDVAAAPHAREFAHLFVLAHASTTHQPPIGLAGDLWHRWQVTPDTWSIWQPLGHPGHAAGPPVVAVNGDDRLEVFTIDGDTGRMWHRSQLDAIDPQGISEWAPVADHGPGFRAAAAELDNTGRLVLVAHTFGSDVWTTTETARGSGKYAPWAKLARGAADRAPGTGQRAAWQPGARAR